MSEPSEYSSAVQPTVPIFEVAFKCGMWWSIPADLSQQMYEQYRNNEDVGYTWDWGNSRYAAFAQSADRAAPPVMMLVVSKLRTSPDLFDICFGASPRFEKYAPVLASLLCIGYPKS